MERREVLKGLSAIAGGALASAPAWSLFATGDSTGSPTPMAAPVRGLIKKNGSLMQPIQITIPHTGADTSVLIKIDGREVEHKTLTAGINAFMVLTEPVIAPKTVRVDVVINGDTDTRAVMLQPVRKIKVYVLPHSHHDLGYTDLQADVIEKQMNNIQQGIDLAQKTASYPEGSRFVWNLEVLWGADYFMRRKSEAEKASFINAVKKGWVSLNGMYANELTGLCRPDELLQLFRYSGELGKQCGVTVNSAMASDVPGFTWGTVTAMSQAGIRYFSTAPNFFDRIGKMMVEWQDKPFWWISPSGKERVLVWIPWTGYALSHVMRLSHDWVGKYQDRLDSVAFPYNISYVRWSGHGDNAAPDPELSEFIKSWNNDFEWPKFVISSTSDAFEDFEKQHGAELPEFKGDLTPYWEDGAGSSAEETKLSRGAADRLTQAATLSALLTPGKYQPKMFNEAWRDVLLYSEHTWGAFNSVSDSENPFVTKQWDFKRNFAMDAHKQSSALLTDVINTYGQSSAGAEVDVHNSTSWPRSELIVLSKELSTAGDHVKDSHGKPVPSQRLSTGELALWAEAIPGFGTARFHISKAAAHAPATPVTIQANMIENGLVRIQVDAETGNVTELTLKSKTDNLIETMHGEQANEYLFLEGGDVSKLQKSGPAKITIEESGPLVAVLLIDSSAPGLNSMVRRVQLAAGADWVDLTNVIDKKRASLNPKPGNGDQGGDFAQHGNKESVQFAFPFKVPDGKMRMDIPLSAMRPELDQLPGSCKNWLPVGRWIDVSSEKLGVTWVTLDAPLVEIGEVSATMLGSQTNPSIWRDYIEPTQKFYSWAMNNHWGTNYRAYQVGKVAFRYALRPHTGADPAESSRLAIGLSQPLIASMAGAGSVPAPMLRIQPEDVLAIAMKPSDDGKAIVIKLFGASGSNRKAKLVWALKGAPSMSTSNTSEVVGKPVDSGEVEVAGWDLVTVRAEITA